MNAFLNSTYHFLSYTRVGMATLLPHREPVLPAQRARFQVQLTFESGEAPLDTISKEMALYGPADVKAFDKSAIRDVEPVEGTGDFEPNYFSYVTFHDQDYPWRYTGFGPTDSKGLMPWLTLITLVAEDVPHLDELKKEFTDPFQDKPDDQKSHTNLRYIEVHKGTSLPKLQECWRWAHVQVITGEADAESTRKAIRGKLENGQAVSRLMCMRRLQPGVLYRSFIVPTFKLTAIANGLDMGEADVGTLSWTDENEKELKVPYFHSFEFRCGLRGDFEDMVRKITPVTHPEKIGRRPFVVGSPGFGISQNNHEGKPLSMMMEGALISKQLLSDNQLDEFSPDEEPDQIRSGIEQLLHLSGDASAGKKWVLPPLYGQWHANKTSLNEAAKDHWFDETNLDPRHRSAAGLGSQVIRDLKEELMQSAWDQAIDIGKKNRMVSHGQLGMEVSRKIFDQKIGLLSESDRMTHSWQLLSKVMHTSNGIKATLWGTIKKSNLPQALLDPSFRKLTRKSGPLAKRSRRREQGYGSSLLASYDDTSDPFRPAGDHPLPAGTIDTCDLFEKLDQARVMRINQKVRGLSFWERLILLIRRFLRVICEWIGLCKKNKDDVWGEFNPSTQSRNFCDQTTDTPSSMEHFAKEAQDYLEKNQIDIPEINDQSTLEDVTIAAMAVLPRALPPIKPKKAPSIQFSELDQRLKSSLDPDSTISRSLAARFKIAAGGLQLIVPGPEFPRAMYKPLESLSADYICPGIDQVKPNKITVLAPNYRFISAYMMSLSHNFNQVLRWHEYPVPNLSRNTFFKQFWEPLVTPDIERRAREMVKVQEGHEDDQQKLADQIRELLEDIKPIHEWHHNKLGQNAAINGKDESAVVLLRSDLFRKYPDTDIYLLDSELTKAEIEWDTERLFTRLHHIQEGAVEDGRLIAPFFKADLKPDISIFGFDLSIDELKEGNMHCVVVQKLNRPRFGLDVSIPEAYAAPDWNNFSWEHLDMKEAFHEYVYAQDVQGPEIPEDTWHESAASVARTTLQTPVRIAFRMDQLLSSSDQLLIDS